MISEQCGKTQEGLFPSPDARVSVCTSEDQLGLGLLSSCSDRGRGKGYNSIVIIQNKVVVERGGNHTRNLAALLRFFCRSEVQIPLLLCCGQVFIVQRSWHSKGPAPVLVLHIVLTHLSPDLDSR